LERGYRLDCVTCITGTEGSGKNKKFCFSRVLRVSKTTSVIGNHLKIVGQLFHHAASHTTEFFSTITGHIGATEVEKGQIQEKLLLSISKNRAVVKA